jgi:hypothetical protein
MTDFVLFGMLAGLIISVFHVAYLSRLVAGGEKSQTKSTRLSVLNFAFWTCGLWLLMGAYVLGFWLIAVVLYVVFKAFR